MKGQFRRSLKGRGGDHDRKPDKEDGQVQQLDVDVPDDIEEDLRFDRPETQRGLMDRKQEDIGFQGSE